jgi:hypothetical protein
VTISSDNDAGTLRPRSNDVLMARIASAPRAGLKEGHDKPDENTAGGDESIGECQIDGSGKHQLQ